jgi:tetratricopeptide (TPR) repeat protein
MGNALKDRVLTGLLLAAVLLVYGNTLVNKFALDDELYILRNPQVTDPSLHAIFSLSPFSYVFRPVSFATLAFNWMLGGPQPAGYHLLNLLMHAGVTWLLFLLLQELLKNVPEGKTIAFAAALLYAVHPIHTEAVSWAVGRMELLAAGFLFAGWLLHLRDRSIESLACFALALLSKESAVAFLPLVVLGDYATGKSKPRVRYALAGGLLLLYLAVLWKVQGGRLGRPDISMYDNMLAVLPANLRILNALRIAWKYVALQIYPAVLSCDYSFNQITLYGDLRHTLAAVVASAAVFGVWIWSLRKKWTGGILAGGIYFAGFAATSNILVPTGTIMGERLAYLPSAGFCLLLALGWNWIRTRKETVAWGILAAVVLVFSVRTSTRNRDWKDAFTLYSSAVRAVPNDARMHANLAGQYFLRNDLDDAAREYQIALRIIPDSPDTLATYAALEYQRGNYQAAGTMMEKAVRMSGRNNINYDFMIATYAAILMKTNHADQALEYLNREISEAPSYPGAWSTRSDLHYQQGDLTAARTDAESALRLDPRDPKAQLVLQMLNAAGSSATSQAGR